jgi:ribosomal protein S12 methylthiotransferase accessory factor
MLAFDGQFGGAQVLHALRRLQERGILVENGSALTASEAAFWSPQGLERGGLGRLSSTPVGLAVIEPLEAAPLVRALRGAGVRAADASDEGGLELVVGASYLEPRFLGRLREARSRGVACLAAKLEGQSAWLGPFMTGGDGVPCPACLEQCLERNRPIANYLARAGRDHVQPASGRLPVSVEVAAGFVALRLADCIVKGELSALSAKLLSLDLRSFQLTEHTVTRRPQCPECGSARWMHDQMLRPIALTEREHVHGDDGGYRTISPEQTHERYRHLVSPVTGVLTSLGELRERSLALLPVYAAGYFVSPLTSAAESSETFDRTSLGKGRSHAQSRASALCEGLERYAAVWQGDEARVRKSFAALAPEAIDPRELQNFSERQYQTRTDKSDRRRMIPLPFDPQQVLDWSPAWSLTHQARRWLPTAYCLTHAPTAPEERVATYNPNGHAAGNCLEEAVLQGFLELVERDASAVWWYNRLERPCVDLHSFDDAFFRQVIDLDRSLGLDLHVLDLTHDLAIPVMVALGLEERTGRYFMGFGCHLDAGLAVQRALTELHQVYDPTGTGESPFKRGDFEHERFLRPSRTLPSTPASAFERPRGKSLAQAIQYCVDAVARAGMETIVLDHTRPDIGLATVKVVVPGLRHFWPRLGPGRLYDVPHQLGWLERPLSESELNPVPLLM